jgi:hypothetical protein
MPTNRPNQGRGRKARSQEQRRGSAALIRVMQGWEGLNDAERLTWDTAAATRGMRGVNFYKQVNLRRLRRGEEMLRLPPPSQSYNPRPLLKGLDIRNRGGRITLELELHRAPDGPRTVWASLPCNLGQKKPGSCPRLGWLPVGRGRWRDITGLYFKKHGKHIKAHRLQLVGKRIFVRLRLEVDTGAQLYEQARAVVPKPEVQMDRKAIISSNKVRTGFERASNNLRSIPRMPRSSPALPAPRPGPRRGRAQLRTPKGQAA